MNLRENGIVEEAHTILMGGHYEVDIISRKILQA
jgi:hypothetical protein